MFDVMGKEIKKQQFEELIEMLKALKEKEKIQGSVVRMFQKLIRDEGCSPSAIKYFSYPMAIFEQDGDLVFVNSALSEETGLCNTNLSTGKHSILNRITDANLPILDAVENVFMGKTTFLTGLSDPLDIFMKERSGGKVPSFEYQDAVFFPIPADEGQTALGG